MSNGDTLDGWDFYHPWSDQCGWCVHKHRTLRHVCDAFPKGIPPPIWLGEHDHNNPWQGDGGIGFAPLPDRPQ